MKRRFVVTSSVLVVLAGIGIWWFGLRFRDSSSEQVSATDLRLRQILGRTASLDADGIPLRDVIDQLAAKHGVEIALDRDAIKEAGRDDQEPVILSASGISLRALLDLICEQSGLVVLRRDGAICISTHEAIDKDYGNYIAKVFRLAPPGASFEPFNAEDLANYVRITIDPNSWSYYGGRGKITWVPGAVTVVHRPDVVEEVERLVAEIERWRANSDPTRPFWLLPRTFEDGECIGRIQRKIRKRISVECRDTPLAEVCRRLSREHNVPIVLDVPSLDDVGIDIDNPITITLNDVSLGAALELILADFELTYRFSHEIVQITTPESSEPHSFIRVYPIADLESGPFCLDRHSLEKLITSAIEPDFWDAVGGPGSVDADISGVLIIANILEIHERIERLLFDLRRVFGRQGTREEVLEMSPTFPKVDPKIAHVLDSPTSLRFENTPLAELAAELRKRQGLNVVIEGATCNDHYRDTDIAITAEFEDQPLGAALRQVLADHDLTVVVKDDALLITDADDVEPYVATGLYDTRVLCDPDFGSLGIRELMNLITRVLFPDQWAKSWAPGSCTSIRDVLVVSSDRTTHEAVRSFLRFLEENADSLPRVAQVTGKQDDQLRAQLAEDLLDGSDRWRRAYACYLLTKSPGAEREKLDTLLEAFVREDIRNDKMLRPLLIASIRDTLVADNTGAVALLKSRLSSVTNVECRNQLIPFLSRCGDGSTAALTELLQSDSPSVRSTACVVLSNMGERAAAAVPKLLESLEGGPNRSVWDVLDRIDPKGNLRRDALLCWYESDDEQLRRRAAAVRRCLEALAAPATPDPSKIESLLRQLLIDEHDRSAILRRLEKIDSDGKYGREILFRWYEDDNEEVRRRAADVRRVLNELHASEDGANPFAAPIRYPFE